MTATRTARLCAAAVGVLLVILALGSAPPAASADEGWTVERFDAQIVVRADATLAITEAIDVDFGGQQKHGIFRQIPVRYRYDGSSDRLYDLRVRSVTDATGRTWPYQRADKGAAAIIRIGDPDRTVSGRQSYRLVYEVTGALNAFADHDELFWNVNGVWPVRTRATSAHVRLDKGEIAKVACYQGPAGSTETCAATSRAGAADMTSGRALAEGEQLTIVAAFPKGVVAVPGPTLERRSRDIGDWWDVTPLTAGGAAAVLLLGIGLVGRRWLAGGRDPRGPDTIVPEYEPPGHLRPAEIGLLLDESADAKDLTATIVHLAVRGYLSIEEVAAKGIFGHRDWTLHRGHPPDDRLAPYERRLLEGLFGEGPFGTGDTRKLSDLRGTFHDVLSRAEGDLYAASVQQGWFPADPQGVRVRWALGSVGLLVLGGIVAAGLGIFFGAALVGVALTLVGLVALLVSGAMPRRTAAGRDLLWHIRGFRRYMDTAETDRQRFAERENIFAEYLPYAIVFGSVTKWACAFAGLDVEKATQGWYAGSAVANVGAFSSDLATFSTSVSTAISSTPASSGSSGFGGGGSSGGGGGGGGGGSW